MKNNNNKTTMRYFQKKHSLRKKLKHYQKKNK